MKKVVLNSEDKSCMIGLGEWDSVLDEQEESEISSNIDTRWILHYGIIVPLVSTCTLSAVLLVLPSVECILSAEISPLSPLSL